MASIKLIITALRGIKAGHLDSKILLAKILGLDANESA
jgi:hypothetical protein